MASLNWVPTGVHSYNTESTYDIYWTTDTVVDVTPGHGGQTRYFLSGATFDALHDGCIVTDITVEFTGSQTSFTNDIYAYAEFASILVSTSTLSHSSTNYSASGGAGTDPSVIRAAYLTSSCYDLDATYDATVSMSLPTVTVTYTDNGVPHTLFFGSNF